MPGEPAYAGETMNCRNVGLFLRFVLALVVPLGAGPVLSQTAPPPTPDRSLERVEAYQPGTTTLGDFLRDGWRARDVARGKLGIIAWRSDQDKGTAEFILGSCGDLQDLSLASVLDMTSNHNDLANPETVRFTEYDFHWPNGIVVSSKDGKALRCAKSYHLVFADKVLKSREQITDTAR